MWSGLQEKADVKDPQADGFGNAGAYHDDTGIGLEIEVSLIHEDSSLEVN